MQAQGFEPLGLSGRGAWRRTFPPGDENVAAIGTAIPERKSATRGGSHTKGKSDGKMLSKKHWFFRGFGRRTFPSIPGVRRARFCLSQMPVFLEENERIENRPIKARGKSAVQQGNSSGILHIRDRDL
jgi:hypothetical protein